MNGSSDVDKKFANFMRDGSNDSFLIDDLYLYEYIFFSIFLALNFFGNFLATSLSNCFKAFCP